jgi:hypothetical protein
MSISNSIVQAYSSIDRVHSIEKEREETMSTEAFQNWCKQMHIGSRVETINHRANELMDQYSDYYPNWVKRMYS